MQSHNQHQSIQNRDSPVNGRDSSISPPAFLDLADSAARLGSNLPDINARIELKRLEHERQRSAQRKMFEDQMRALEQQQLQEEHALLVGTASGNQVNNGAGNTLTGDAGLHLSNMSYGSNSHQVALSAPTTPPLGHLSLAVGGAVNGSMGRHNNGYSSAAGSVASTSPGTINTNGLTTSTNGTSTPTTNGTNPAVEFISTTVNKRKSVNITPSPEIISSIYGSGVLPSHHGQFMAANHIHASSPLGQAHNYGHGARSMPASRRGSAGSRDGGVGDDLVAGLAGLGIGPNADGQGLSSILTSLGSAGRANGRNDSLNTATGYPGGFGNSALLFDDELDKDMHNSLRHLPTATEDDRFLRTDPYSRKLSVSSAALDLAPLSQTPPRSSFMGSRAGLAGGELKSSEWPQFSGLPRPSSSEMRSSRLSNMQNQIGNGISVGSGAVTAGNGTPVLGGTPILGTHPLAAIGNGVPDGLSSGIVSSLNKHISISTANTPQLQNGSGGLHRPHSPEGRGGSPSGLLSDGSLSVGGAMGARSVPATPLSTLAPGALGHLKNQGNVHGSPAVDGPYGPGDMNYNGGNRNAAYDNITFGSIADNELQYGADPNFSLQSSNVDSRFGGYSGSQGSNMDMGSNGLDSQGGIPRGGANTGSTALYHHHGSRYGLGAVSNGSSAPNGQAGSRMVSSGSSVGGDSKIGLHGSKHKRGDIDREFNRFAGTRIEELVGEILGLCKDQHGCRYLQKKLEEGVPEHRDMIFRETFGHFADLMTDPFGNYLCQKLLEYSTDEQRNIICESVAQDLVSISLNMHGTRAVQKMIDFLSTQRQIHSIIVALSMHVVTLIKDLNGNHVVQKCLNKLVAEDNQFIYNAVAAHCVEVATHRHGCCVLQRCIDHASDSQRVQLVTEITYNALTLVQDPYGNYVVQYILDLNDNRFSDAVIRQFVGNVCALSVQKFSSNVIEKCIRVAEHNTRKMLIEELLNRSRLEKLLRDSFGNYCVQTALDYAEPNQRMMLVEGIRPILPLIRNTPYGKRIQSKLQREQMEAANAYGGGFQTHAALVNMALANNGMNPHSRHIPQQPSLHHAGQLNDPYTSRAALYSHNLGPGGMQPLHHHGHGLAQHSIDAGYGSHPLLQGAAGHSMLGGAGIGGLSGYNAPLSGGFNGNMALSAGLSDPYRNGAYPYGF